MSFFLNFVHILEFLIVSSLLFESKPIDFRGKYSDLVTQFLHLSLMFNLHIPFI